MIAESRKDRFYTSKQEVSRKNIRKKSEVRLEGNCAWREKAYEAGSDRIISKCRYTI